MTILKADHREAKKLLAKLAESDEGPEREAMVGELTKALRLHMELEESLVYPLVEREVGEEDAEEADIEHGLARDGLDTLNELVAKPGFGAAVQMLQGGIDQHVTEEETELLPELKSAMGRKDWSDLMRDFDLFIATKIVPNAVTIPGVSSKGKMLFADKYDTLTVDGDWLNFTVVADSGMPAHASFLFFKQADFGGQASLLFTEQFSQDVPFEKQLSLPVVYEGIRLDAGLRLDLLVAGSVIVELKAVRSIAPEHQAQIINYLNATGIEVGLLINFGSPKLEYKRFTRSKDFKHG